MTGFSPSLERSGGHTTLPNTGSHTACVTACQSHVVLCDPSGADTPSAVHEYQLEACNKSTSDTTVPSGEPQATTNSGQKEDPFPQQTKAMCRALCKYLAIVLLGLCCHTYHDCVARGVSLAEGRPLHGLMTASALPPPAASPKCPATPLNQEHQGTVPGGAVTGNGQVAGSVPSALWPLLELIVTVVERSVWGYFITFIYCWQACLSAMTVMIDRYIAYLGELTRLLTAWPMNLIGVFGMGIALGGAALILSIVLKRV